MTIKVKIIHDEVDSKHAIQVKRDNGNVHEPWNVLKSGESITLHVWEGQKLVIEEVATIEQFK